MSVAEFLNSQHETAFSFEVLPPVKGHSMNRYTRQLTVCVSSTLHISTSPLTAVITSTARRNLASTFVRRSAIALARLQLPLR